MDLYEEVKRKINGTLIDIEKFIKRCTTLIKLDFIAKLPRVQPCKFEQIENKEMGLPINKNDKFFSLNFHNISITVKIYEKHRIYCIMTSLLSSRVNYMLDTKERKLVILSNVQRYHLPTVITTTYMMWQERFISKIYYLDHITWTVDKQSLTMQIPLTPIIGIHYGGDSSLLLIAPPYSIIDSLEWI